MRSWYRFANNDMAMARDIATWLSQAANGNVDIATMQDDISMRMSGVDDPALLDAAVQSAISMVSSAQGGQILPVQQEMISAIYSRLN